MARVYRDPTMRTAQGKAAWCIDYTGLDGRRHRERTNAATREEAERLLRLRQSEVDKATIVGVRSIEAIKPRTFHEFVEEEYMPHCVATHTPATYKRDQSLLNAVLPFFGSMLLRNISSGDVQRYIDQRAHAKSRYRRALRPATVNREVMYVSGVLSEAIRRGYLDRNPTKGIPRLPEHNDRLRWLTYDEEKRLMEHAPEFVRPIILTSLHSGMRYGEVLGLMWTDIDLEKRLVRVSHSKNHRTRYIPMNADLEELFRSLLGRNKSVPFVFANPATGKPYLDVMHAFGRVCRAARLHDVTFHTLRHTFASRLAQAGVPLNTIRELLGHGSMQMTMRYAHLAPNNLRDAVSVLSAPRLGAEVGRKLAEETATRHTTP